MPEKIIERIVSNERHWCQYLPSAQIHCFADHKSLCLQRRIPTRWQKIALRCLLGTRNLPKKPQKTPGQSYYLSVLHFLRMPLPGRASPLRCLGPPLHGLLSTAFQRKSMQWGLPHDWVGALRPIMASTARSGSVRRRSGCSPGLRHAVFFVVHGRNCFMHIVNIFFPGWHLVTVRTH